MVGLPSRKATVSSGNGSGGITSGNGTGGAITEAAEAFVASILRGDSSTARAKQRYVGDLANALTVLSQAFGPLGQKLGGQWGDAAAEEACHQAGKQVFSANEAIISAQINWDRREAAHLEHIGNPGAKGEDGKFGFDVSKQS